MSVDNTMNETQRQILGIKLEAARKMAPVLRQIDVSESGSWKSLVNGTLGVGVSEEKLARQLGCSISTVGRWSSGHSSPAEFARVAMRDLMVGMVEEKIAEAEALLAVPAPAEDEAPRPGM